MEGDVFVIPFEYCLKSFSSVLFLNTGDYSLIAVKKHPIVVVADDYYRFTG